MPVVYARRKVGLHAMPSSCYPASLPIARIRAGSPPVRLGSARRCDLTQKALKAVVLSGLAACLTAAPQAPAASEERAAQVRERFEQLQARLKLTPEQAEKLKPVLQKQFEEMRQVRDNNASDTSRRGKAKMMREMKDVQDKHAGEIAAILTPEQKTEWAKIKDEAKQKARQKRGR